MTFDGQHAAVLWVFPGLFNDADEGLFTPGGYS